MSADDQSQVKWLNYGLFPPAGSAGLASAPTTAPNRVWPRDRWTVQTQGQRHGSLRADDVKDCRKNPFLWKSSSPAFLDRSPSLCDPLPLGAARVAEGLAGWMEPSLMDRNEQTCASLRSEPAAQGTGGLCLRDTQRLGQGFRTQWGLYHSSLWNRFQVNIYGVIILFLTLSLAYI